MTEDFRFEVNAHESFEEPEYLSASSLLEDDYSECPYGTPLAALELDREEPRLVLNAEEKQEALEAVNALESACARYSDSFNGGNGFEDLPFVLRTRKGMARYMPPDTDHERYLFGPLG